MLVWGTVSQYLRLRGFSWKRGINDFNTVVSSSRLSALGIRIYLDSQPTDFHQDNQRLAHLAFFVPPSQYCEVREY